MDSSNDKSVRVSFKGLLPPLSSKSDSEIDSLMVLLEALLLSSLFGVRMACKILC